MNDTEYTRLLLDSSFKEANLFWIRNSAITVFQSVIVGFFLRGMINHESIPITLFFIICGIGISFGAIHLIIIEYSEKENLKWFRHYKDWVKSQEKSNVYSHLMVLAKKQEYKEWSFKYMITWMKFIPMLFLFLWIFLTASKILAIYNIICLLN